MTTASTASHCPARVARGPSRATRLPVTTATASTQIEGSLTSSRNIAKGNRKDGFLWETDVNGTSTSDVASGNVGNGMTVNVGSGNAMTLTDLVSTSGKAYGLLVKSGSATVVRGNFSVNSLDGIRVTAGGTGKLSYA